MAAITIVGITEGGIGTSAATFTVTAPATVDNGDLIIFGASSDGDAVISENTTSDWTLLGGQDQSAGGGLYVFYRICDGSEDSQTWTFNCQGTATETAVYEMIQLRNWHGTTPPEISAGATNAADSSPDPNNVTASWGAEDENLFVTFAGCDSDTFTGAPSGYINFGEIDSDTLGASGSCSAAIATKSANAASDDAGVWAGINDSWAAFTVVVRPAGAGAATSLVIPNRLRRNTLLRM